MEPVDHGLDSKSGRRLFSLALAMPSAMPERITIPSRKFVCLIAWDARQASVDEITQVVIPLLESGASYFVCWGPDCGRVHDVIDEIVTGPSSPVEVPENSCIMTTSHESEPLAEALWFFLCCTSPDELYQALTEAAIGVSIGSGPWATEIASVLSDPHAFLQAESDRGAA